MPSAQGRISVRRRPKDGNNGKDGKAIYLHLDNQNDTLLYDSDGTLISDPVTSNIALLVNGKEVTPVGVFSITKSNVEAEINGSVLTVSACTAASGYAVVSCTYEGEEYTAKMSIIRRVDAVKYSIRVSDTSFTYNETTGGFDKTGVVVTVYREDVSTKEETLVGDLYAKELTLKCSINGGSESSVPYTDGKFEYKFKSTDTSVTFVVYKGEELRDRQTVTIAHVSNGDNGVNYVMQFDPPFWSVPVNPNVSGYPSIGFNSLSTAIKVLKNGEEVDLGSNGITTAHMTAVADRGSLGLTKTVKNIYYTIPVGTVQNSIATKITVTITPPEGSALPAIVGVVPLQFPQRGLTGPMGEKGDTPIPYGTWDSTVVYTKPTGVLPIVWCEAGVEGNNEEVTTRGYWALQADSSAAGTVPTEGNGWEAFDMFKYVFTEVLMADFALLSQAVFHKQYMFSFYGIDESGASVPYNNKMFGADGKLNGSIIPKLFLDLEQGGAAFGKLSELHEPFHVKKIVDGEAITNYIHYMDMNRSHNITASPRIYTEYDGWPHDYCGCVVLPQYGTESSNVQWSEDGTHATVVYQFDTNKAETTGGFGASNTPFIVVCADARMFSENNYKTTDGVSHYDNELDNDGSNCFIWRGWRSKFIMLSHGTTLKLRSVKSIEENISYDNNGNAIVETSDVGLNWYVENTSDFVSIPMKVRMQSSEYDDTTNYNTTELANITLYNAMSNSHDRTHIALGSGLDSANESVFTNSSIFIDINEGVNASTGSGATAGYSDHVKVGFVDKIN